MPSPSPQPERNPSALLTSAEAARSRARIEGVDLARGLAVLGMFAAHVGPDPAAVGTAGLLWELPRGRSSALFALLAGLSVMLVRRRAEPAGAAWGRARARLVVRALALIALGTALTSLGTPVVVILTFYGGYFLLALPFSWRRSP